MSDTIEFHSRVGPDGTLDLHVPLGPAEAGTDVIVTIRPIVAETKKDDPSEWHRFVEETYGSCAELGVERAPQGEFESREKIE